MSRFVEYLHEVFADFGEIRARRMFGGHGIYRDEFMFALVTDDVLYLKADSESVAFFKERGLNPFEYTKNGKTINMSYYLAPEEIYDDPDEAKVWADRAYAAAMRAKKRKR